MAGFFYAKMRFLLIFKLPTFVILHILSVDNRDMANTLSNNSVFMGFLPILTKNRKNLDINSYQTYILNEHLKCIFDY